MPDVIHELYSQHVYPPMSHPLSDPAVSAVAARMGGLEMPHPRRARILEIGCCSGHNLLPLAKRWPESRFVGIDLAERSIDEARERGALAGIANVNFHAADLRDFRPDDGPFDFIIAHGFFSWVPDDVKVTLLDFCRKHLSASGIATISFNIECGWKPRLAVIAKVRAIQQALGGDQMAALDILKSLGGPEVAIIDDMLAKGPAILAFDDFGPINDPWPLDRFAHAASHAGLRWLGESDPGDNIPKGLDHELLAELRSRGTDPLGFQLAVDEAVGRTFRSGVLCRDDAVVAERISSSAVLDFAVRAGVEPEDAEAKKLYRTVTGLAPACVPVMEVIGTQDPRMAARRVLEGVNHGWLRPRIEPVSFPSEPPAFPKLDTFRLLCAQRHLPVVDVWHVPCDFPAAHFEVLGQMDGTRSLQQLVGFARQQCAELAFAPWLAHLAGRGFFS